MGLIGLEPPPSVPEGRVPLYAGAILDIQRRALFWARASVAASLLAGLAALALAWRGTVPWVAALPFFLLPLLPIAAQTRIEELGRKTLDQIRDLPNKGSGNRGISRDPPGEL